MPLLELFGDRVVLRLEARDTLWLFWKMGLSAEMSCEVSKTTAPSLAMTRVSIEGSASPASAVEMTNEARPTLNSLFFWSSMAIA
jgi:hypothetical protein